MSNIAATRPTVARIDLDSLAFNFHSVRKFLGPDVKIMAVVKADAYGHGAAACARRLEQEGADRFATALLEEAMELRDAGVRGQILCFGGCWDGQEEIILANGITPVLFDIESAERFGNRCNAAGAKGRIHIKVDTGMGRVGVPLAEVSDFAERLALIPGLEIEGVLTHFASADDLGQTELTEKQISGLSNAVNIFERAGFRPTVIDAANSPGAVAHPASRGNLVRIGGLLYGLGGDILPKGVKCPELRPVMTVHTCLAQVKSVPSGTGLGYGHTFVTRRDSLVGTIAIGYQDGLPRGLSNVGQVIVNGVLAPIVGRVSMDWTIIDITGVPGAKRGDTVTVIGSQKSVEVRAEDIAARLGTISYEITCGISQRVPRHFVSGHDDDLGNAVSNVSA